MGRRAMHRLPEMGHRARHRPKTHRKAINIRRDCAPPATSDHSLLGITNPKRNRYAVGYENFRTVTVGVSWFHEVADPTGCTNKQGISRTYEISLFICWWRFFWRK